MDEQNRKAIKKAIYLFCGFILVSIIGGVFFISLSRMETDANRYKKNKALEQIEKEFRECRRRKIENEDLTKNILKCVSEKFMKEEALN